MTREGGGRHELFISLSIASLRAKALNLVLFLVLYHLLRDPLFWLGIIPSIPDNLLQRIEEPTQGWIAGKLSGHPIKNCVTSQSKTTISFWPLQWRHWNRLLGCETVQFINTLGANLHRTSAGELPSLFPCSANFPLNWRGKICERDGNFTFFPDIRRNVFFFFICSFQIP